jgi:hypothetical protein
MKPFSANQFTGTRYETAEDKALAANQLAAFLLAGCPVERFTKRVYDALYLHSFGHIAHYDRWGFYDTWFSTPSARAAWVSYVQHGGAYGFKPIERTDLWGDFEHVVADWLESSGIAERFIAEYDAAVESAERAELARLQEKYS